MQVRKPWGYEYLAYENEHVGIWILHINKDESTSMHCHPLKDTGLIVLSGEVDISFLNSTHRKIGLQKTMIRKGLFHSSRAINDDVIILEIESPKDKQDLIRLYDNYGRRFQPYETNRNEGYELDLSNDVQGYGRTFNFKRVSTKGDIEPAELFVFVTGGLIHTDGKMVVKCGDVLNYNVLNTLLDNFKLLPTEYIAIC